MELDGLAFDELGLESLDTQSVKGRGIAYNEGKITLHAPISVMVDDVDAQGNPVR